MSNSRDIFTPPRGPDHPFLFESYTFDETTALLTLRYAYQNGSQFVEEIQFPQPIRPLTGDEHTVFDRLARLLFLMAGVSYYKAYAPTHLLCPAFPLDPATAQFVENVYRQGLGEFAWRNQLDLRGRIRFAIDPTTPQAAPLPISLSNDFLVPVGGGKDSALTIETLKKSGRRVTLFALTSPAGVAKPIQNCIDVSGLSSLTVTRRLSPTIITLNQQGAYNGHIPITAILSVIALMTTMLHQTGTVVMSNEYSASTPNLQFADQNINHQYSKSWEFECDLTDYLHNAISPHLHYFSLLRPWSEAAILQRFAKLTAYHPVFRSCNAAFRQEGDKRAQHWCGDCPKCRFVFLGLAPFMSPSQLASIFGHDLLTDETQTTGFAELCGFTGHKPFECVGETDECAHLLIKAAQQSAWASHAVIRALQPDWQAYRQRPDFDAQEKSLFAPHAEHQVPPALMELFHDT